MTIVAWSSGSEAISRWPRLFGHLVQGQIPDDYRCMVIWLGGKFQMTIVA
jgi:hypothetical protein